MLNKTVQLRTKYLTLRKAKAHANEVLPAEPESLVDQYLAGKERPSKELVVASRRSGFSKPALPTSQTQRSVTKACFCKGKCATKKCNCKAIEVSCDSQYSCKLEKVKIVNKTRLVFVRLLDYNILKEFGSRK